MARQYLLNLPIRRCFRPNSRA